MVERVSDTSEVRVATLNLWGTSGAWDERRSVLIEGFRQLQPNVVALQEAVKTDRYDQVADLLGSEYHLVHQSGRSADGVGASIASCWPLREVREADLHVTSRLDPSQRWIGSAAAAEVLTPEPIGPLLFVHHKPSWQRGFEYERELQAAAAARFVEGLVGERNVHVVLAGDFDATPEAASVRFWRGLQSLGEISVCYRDAWGSTHPGEPGHTFTAENPLVTAENWDWELELGRRIDHIFVRCSAHGPTLDIRTCERIFDEPVGGVWGSDHFGFCADLSAQTSAGRPLR